MKIKHMQSYLLAFLVLFAALQITLGVKGSKATINDLNESNSSIIVPQEIIDQNTTLELSVRIADETNTTIEDANVTLTATDGYFLETQVTSINGNTSADGFFNVTWCSPRLGFVDSQVVDFQATVTYPGSDDIVLMNDITVRHLDDSAIINSHLITPDTIVSGETVEFSTRVLNTYDIPSEAIQVTYSDTSLEGTYESDFFGMTDGEGFFNTTWTAPELDLQQPEVNITLTALVEANDQINATLTKNITIQLTAAESLTITVLTAPEAVTSEAQTTLVLLVMAESTPATGGEVYISVNDGFFNNSNTDITLTINATGHVIVNWTAPAVEAMNLTCDFNVEATYALIEGSTLFTITTTPILGNFSVAWDHPDSIMQNVTMTVTLTVKNAADDTAVENVQVSLLLESGNWTETGTPLFNGQTDSNGEIQVTFNGSNIQMSLERRDVAINTTLYKDGFNEFSSGSSFELLKQPDSFTFAAEADSQIITAGDSVILTLTALMNGEPHINATFDLTANAGTFPNGEETYSAKTNENGELEMMWSSADLTAITDPVEITIVIEYVNSGLAAKSITITVNPTGAATSSEPSDGQPAEDLTPAIIVASIIALLALIGAGFFVKRKL